MPDSGLNNQVVLITGSSRGIGAATARIAQENGARVVLHGRTESPHLKTIAADLDCDYIVCDVTNDDEVRSVLQDLFSREPKIHALVNCVGYPFPKPFFELTDKDWLEVLNVNLFSVFRVCQAVAPVMLKAGYGRIVTISSIRGEGIGSSPRTMAYSSAKAAVQSMTIALAKELAPAVNVNAVAPGFINTDITETWNDAIWKETRKSLVGRIGEAQEIAELLVFLASEKASFITGQTIIADGGYLMAGK